METYQRTYSHTLGQQFQGLDVSANDAFSTPSITIDDYAIACALAGIQEGEQGTAPDTSMDAELALQLHERESARLLRQPSSKARRRSRRLRSLLRHLKPTRVRPGPTRTHTVCCRPARRPLLLLVQVPPRPAALHTKHLFGKLKCRYEGFK